MNCNLLKKPCLAYNSTGQRLFAGYADGLRKIQQQHLTPAATCVELNEAPWLQRQGQMAVYLGCRNKDRWLFWTCDWVQCSYSKELALLLNVLIQALCQSIEVPAGTSHKLNT